MIETLQRINNIAPNLTISQLLDIINIISEPKLTKDIKDIPPNGLITIGSNDIDIINKTTSTKNPFTVSSYV